jgi:hypothetical protein
LEALKAENHRLRSDLETALQQLATHNAVSVTAPAHVSPPTVAQTIPTSTFSLPAEPIASTSTGFEGFSSADSRFGAAADSGFGGFADPADGFDAPDSGFSDQNFSTTATGFGSFGSGDASASSDFNSFGGDAFSAFASDPQPVTVPANGGNGFAAFDMDGFGTASASPAAQASAFDAFDF